MIQISFSSVSFNFFFTSSVAPSVSNYLVLIWKQDRWRCLSFLSLVASPRRPERGRTCLQCPRAEVPTWMKDCPRPVVFFRWSSLNRCNCGAITLIRSMLAGLHRPRRNSSRCSSILILYIKTKCESIIIENNRFKWLINYR